MMRELFNRCALVTLGVKSQGNEFNYTQCYHVSSVIREDADMRGSSVLTSKIEAEVELLERHVVMLNAIRRHEPIGIIRLAELLSIPQHKVRYSLRILEQEGLINPSPEGAITTEKLSEFYERVVPILDRMEGTVGKLKVQLEEESRKNAKD